MPRDREERTPEERERRRRERERREHDREPEVDANRKRERRKPSERRERSSRGAEYERDRRRDERDNERRRRRRNGHQKTDSTNELLPKDDSPSPTKTPRSSRRRDSSSYGYGTPGESSTPRIGRGGSLSHDTLAKLDKANYKSGWGKGNTGVDGGYLDEVRGKEKALEDERIAQETDKDRLRKEERKGLRENKERSRRRNKDACDDMGIRVTAVPSDDDHAERRRSRRIDYTESELDAKEERRQRRREEKHKRRVISGPLAEEGDVRQDSYDLVAEKRGGAGGSEYQYLDDDEARRKKRKWIWIGTIVFVVILAIVIPVAVVVSGKNKDEAETNGSSSGDRPGNSELDGISESDIPDSAKGGLLDPFTWWDTTDFNVTYTEETVGGLSVMGLFSSWDNNVQGNDKVPNLQDSFEYGKMPVRGVNVGGWLNIEPFITPSLFESYSTRDGVIDEWTLTSKLGPTKSAQILEKHYSAFINKQTFAEIRDAGFDHVRIPYGYWAITTYDGDPYVPKIAWRYLLRGIEYCRQNGLRVKLDIHGLPGSQNGWNHSGRQGEIRWLNGTDGNLNAQRSLDIHDQLSQFFAQERYKNVVTMYGLANEPRMVELNTDSVLDWTESAVKIIRDNGVESILVFGDGFMGLDKWQGRLQNIKNLLLDVHQYVIFNVDQIKLNHQDKVSFACDDWTRQSLRSMDTTTGFGPTMCGEWSQADTDCTQYINNVGQGTRWEGTYNTGNVTTSVLRPTCPTNNNPTCSCEKANADPSSYSDQYRQFLLYFAEAQMHSFEQGWGWFYWTWKTEKATQWSYKLGMEAGILPQKAYDRTFNCDTDVPDWGSQGLEEFY